MRGQPVRAEKPERRKREKRQVFQPDDAGDLLEDPGPELGPHDREREQHGRLQPEPGFGRKQADKGGDQRQIPGVQRRQQQEQAPEGEVGRVQRVVLCQPDPEPAEQQNECCRKRPELWPGPAEPVREQGVVLHVGGEAAERREQAGAGPPVRHEQQRRQQNGREL